MELLVVLKSDIGVKELDFMKNFITYNKFISQNNLLNWVGCETTKTKLDFNILVSKSDLNSN